MNMHYPDRFNELVDFLKQYPEAVLAYSGGVDSTLLLYAGRSAWEDRFTALTLRTPYVPPWEIRDAVQWAAQYHVHHEIIDLPTDNHVADNPPRRCYICKRLLFQRMLDYCAARRIATLIDGTNADDQPADRPGMQALQELHIVSPLNTLGFHKAEIRQISQDLGLPTWDKPAYACLMTRFTTNQRVSDDQLRIIGHAEELLHDAGYKNVRVRIHNDTARIEMPPSQWAGFTQDKMLPHLISLIREVGCDYVTLDLVGR